MRLFGWFRKKETEEDLQDKKTVGEYIDDMEKPALVVPVPFRADSREEIEGFVQNALSQIDIANRAVEDSKDEYEAVTNSLKDIQIITDIPPEAKAELAVAAEMIKELSAEREAYQKSPNKISEEQYLKMESYGENIRAMMKRLDDDEKYAVIIKNDMQAIDGEKTEIRYEIEECQDKIDLYKRLMGWVLGMLGAVVVFTAVNIAMLESTYDAWIYGGLACIGVLLVMIFAKQQEERRELRFQERKLNRAISLLNKAKVRYVNIQNSIDYQHMKYGVESAYELNHIWGIYLEMKRERELYRHSSRELHDAETQLISILSDYQLIDPRIWVHRSAALLDEREMVEVRHELNTRRQKLRKNMEYNRQVAESTSRSIQDFARMNKTFAEEIMNMVRHKSLR
ncbi:MAG: hypothetical protein J6J86_02675 [Lachnospiraceae bacterium]|nr:hypothetical protein [Lachnospiraceae bacterium]